MTNEYYKILVGVVHEYLSNSNNVHKLQIY